MSYDEKFLNLIVEFITMSKGRYNTTVLDYGYLSKKYPTMKQFFEEEYGIDENTDENTYRQLLFNIVNFPFEYWSPTYITDEKVLLFFYCGDYENGRLPTKRLKVLMILMKKPQLLNLFIVLKIKLRYFLNVQCVIEECPLKVIILLHFVQRNVLIAKKV